MRSIRPSFALISILLAATPALAQSTQEPQRETNGNRVTENIPRIPVELVERLDRYQNTRGASFQSWTA